MVLVITEKHCFYPDEFEYLTPDQWNLEYEPFELQSVDGLTLTGWHILPDKAAEPLNRTVLHLHGNAQNMTAHLLGSYFLALAGFRLITFDYRGYGRSQGRPGLEGIIADGRSVVQMLLDHPFGRDEPLTMFGQSMGAFCAAHLLGDFPGIRRAVLEAGLISFRDLFTEAYPDALVEVPEGFSTIGPPGRKAGRPNCSSMAPWIRWCLFPIRRACTRPRPNQRNCWFWKGWAISTPFPRIRPKDIGSGWFCFFPPKVIDENQEAGAQFF